MKFKQVLAGLLVGTMVVTSAPVSGLGALSALAASEEAETKNYNYTKLTEGLTASADCANGTNTMNAVLNGNPDDYWHSAWEGDNQPVKQGGEVIMNSNNNITLTLTEASTVKNWNMFQMVQAIMVRLQNAIFIIRHQPKMQNSRSTGRSIYVEFYRK